MHPDIGPKLASGAFYEESRLPELLKRVYREAQVPVEGLDFEWRLPGDARPPRGAAPPRA
jgi:hypothetical protein